jgi:hypothetical protein
MLLNVLFAGIVFGLLFDHEGGGSQAHTNAKFDFQVCLPDSSSPGDGGITVP